MRNTLNLKPVLVLLFTLCFISCSVFKKTAEVSTEKKEPYTAKIGVLPYRISLPNDYKKNKKYPLILVLHGAGERGNDNVAQLAHGADLFSTNTKSKFPAIVVFPQCPTDDYWSNVKKTRDSTGTIFNYNVSGPPTLAMDKLQLLIRDIIANYNVDTSKMYVGGLSMGGMGTFELVRRNPNMFAAAFAICGGAHPDTAPLLKNTPFWIFHGDVDAVVNYKYSVAIADALKALDANVKLTLYKDVNHNSWENAFAEPELLPWLFSFEKDKK